MSLFLFNCRNQMMFRCTSIIDVDSDEKITTSFPEKKEGKEQSNLTKSSEEQKPPAQGEPIQPLAPSKKEGEEHSTLTKRSEEKDTTSASEEQKPPAQEKTSGEPILPPVPNNPPLVQDTKPNSTSESTKSTESKDKIEPIQMDVLPIPTPAKEEKVNQTENKAAPSQASDSPIQSERIDLSDKSLSGNSRPDKSEPNKPNVFSIDELGLKKSSVEVPAQAENQANNVKNPEIPLLRPENKNETQAPSGQPQNKKEQDPVSTVPFQKKKTPRRINERQKMKKEDVKKPKALTNETSNPGALQITKVEKEFLEFLDKDHVEALLGLPQTKKKERVKTKRIKKLKNKFIKPRMFINFIDSKKYEEDFQAVNKDNGGFKNESAEEKYFRLYGKESTEERLLRIYGEGRVPKRIEGEDLNVHTLPDPDARTNEVNTVDTNNMNTTPAFKSQNETQTPNNDKSETKKQEPTGTPGETTYKEFENVHIREPILTSREDFHQSSRNVGAVPSSDEASSDEDKEREEVKFETGPDGMLRPRTCFGQPLFLHENKEERRQLFSRMFFAAPSMLVADKLSKEQITERTTRILSELQRIGQMIHYHNDLANHFNEDQKKLIESGNNQKAQPEMVIINDNFYETGMVYKACFHDSIAFLNSIKEEPMEAKNRDLKKMKELSDALMKFAEQVCNEKIFPMTIRVKIISILVKIQASFPFEKGTLFEWEDKQNKKNSKYISWFSAICLLSSSAVAAFLFTFLVTNREAT